MRWSDVQERRFKNQRWEALPARTLYNFENHNESRKARELEKLQVLVRQPVHMRSDLAIDHNVPILYPEEDMAELLGITDSDELKEDRQLRGLGSMRRHPFPGSPVITKPSDLKNKRLRSLINVHKRELQQEEERLLGASTGLPASLSEVEIKRRSGVRSAPTFKRQQVEDADEDEADLGADADEVERPEKSVQRRRREESQPESEVRRRYTDDGIDDVEDRKPKRVTAEPLHVSKAYRAKKERDEEAIQKRLQEKKRSTDERRR